MTEAEYLALAPRERDAVVAEARGETPILSGPNRGRYHSGLPFYTTLIASAWELVEEMRGEGWLFTVDDLGFDGEKWRVRFDKDREVSSEWHIGEHDDEKIAICLAYLKAKGVISG